jgi:hypothetical protein
MAKLATICDDLPPFNFSRQDSCDLKTHLKTHLKTPFQVHFLEWSRLLFGVRRLLFGVRRLLFGVSIKL